MASALLLIGAWLLVRGPGGSGGAAQVRTSQGAGTAVPGAESASPSVVTAKETPRGAPHLTLKMDSRIIDEDGNPVDDVDVIVMSAPSAEGDGDVKESFPVSKTISHDFDGDAPLRIEFWKDGYYILWMTYEPPEGSGSDSAASDTVQRSDLVMKRIPSARTYARRYIKDCTPITLSYAGSGDWSVSVHPEIGTMATALFDSPEAPGVGPDHQTGSPAPASVHLDFAPASSFQQMPAPEAVDGNVVYSPPHDLRARLILENGYPEDGFIPVEGVKAPDDPVWHYPKEMAAAPQSGYRAQLDIPASEWGKRGEYHYFYYFAKGHYGKGYWTHLAFANSPQGSTSRTTAYITLRMVGNPIAQDVMVDWLQDTRYSKDN